MKRFFGRILIAFLICLVVGGSLAVSAEVPYDSYTYWSGVGGERAAVYNKAMYEPDRLIKASDIGVKGFTKIKDIFVLNDNLYILDSDSRIVITDRNYKVIREIGLIDGKEGYKDAASIYVYGDGTIYICDKEGKRILHITEEGKLLNVITLPSSPLIPKDFDFSPIDVVKDSHGYLYVLCDGSYYGALLYSPENEFVSFYGANKVVNSFTGVIKNIIDRMFPNNEKKANTAQRLPYCFVDIDIDNKDFIYASNGFTNYDDLQGQIRKLSPGTGENILDTENINYVDSEMNEVYGKQYSRQNISDLKVDNDGFIYGLEAALGKIFVYDEMGNILTVFGGGMLEGNQLGLFGTVSGLALMRNGEEVLVSDSTTNFITAFKINNFGKEVKSLITLTSKGKYSQVKEGWENLIKEDANFQPAYSGLAKVYLNEKNYVKAMELAKEGYDRETYADAFKYQRLNYLSKYFLPLLILLVLVIAGSISLLIISSKRKLVLIKNREVRLMLSSVFHPVNTFTDIKEKGYGSVGLSVILVLLYYVSDILQTLAGGFAFSNDLSASFNSIIVFAKTVGLIVLWVAADWMVCTLLGGKGKLREIIIVTCYSLIPLIVEKLIRLIMTNILIPEEAGFLVILDTIALIISGLMLIIGLIRIHDFDFVKFVGTTALAVAGIVALVFLIILVFILLQHFYFFVKTLFSELLAL